MPDVIYKHELHITETTSINQSHIFSLQSHEKPISKDQTLIMNKTDLSINFMSEYTTREANTMHDFGFTLTRGQICIAKQNRIQNRAFLLKIIKRGGNNYFTESARL